MGVLRTLSRPTPSLQRPRAALCASSGVGSIDSSADPDPNTSVALDQRAEERLLPGSTRPRRGAPARYGSLLDGHASFSFLRFYAVEPVQESCGWLGSGSRCRFGVALHVCATVFVRSAYLRPGRILIDVVSS